MQIPLSGGFQLIERSLNLLNNYQRRKGILPLQVYKRQVKVVENIGWVTCELTNNSSKKKHGSSTQIFCKSKGSWRIIHDHFSK